MAKKKSKVKSYAHLIVDMSGSMGSVRDITVDSINEFVNGLKDNDSTISITFFEGGNVKHVRDCVHINEYKKVDEEYMPSGMTNLYDAIGETISYIDSDVILDEDETVSLVIITDGYENCSKEYSLASIKSLLDRKQKKDEWLVSYIGANQNGLEVGESMGVDGKFSATFKTSAKGFRSMAVNSASKINEYAQTRSTLGASVAKGAVAYSDEERAGLVEED